MSDKPKKSESLFKCFADEGDNSCALGFCEYCSKLDHCIHCSNLGKSECEDCKFYNVSKTYTGLSSSKDNSPELDITKIF